MPTAAQAECQPRILFGVTSAVSLRLLGDYPGSLARSGWDVHVVAGTQDLGTVAPRRQGVALHEIDMVRDPSPRRDFASLVSWFRLIRKVRPDITSIGTPKAGLIGGVAAAVARIPHRVYVLHGLRYELESGSGRGFYKFAERVAMASAHEVLAVSPSLRQLALDERLCKPSKIRVLGSGSFNGVQTERFAISETTRAEMRLKRWRRNPGPPVVGFVGRIHPDKGLDLLAEALELLKRSAVPVHVLIAGPDDHSQSIEIKKRLRETGLPIEFTGMVDDVATVYPLIDVLCIPSKREGFGNVVIEAAAAGVPALATPTTGLVDTIIHGETGLISPDRSPDKYAELLRSLIDDPELRARLGRNALARVVAEFSQEIVWANTTDYYYQLLFNRTPTQAGPIKRRIAFQKSNRNSSLTRRSSRAGIRS